MTGESGIVLRRRGTLEQVDLAVVLLRADAPAVALATLPAWTFAAALAAPAWWLHPWLGVAVGLLLARLAQVPALLAASDRVTGAPVDLGMRRVLHATGKVALLDLGNVLLGALVSPFLVPVVYLWMRWVFVPEVALLERPVSGARERIADLFAHGFVHAVGVRLWQVGVELWAAGTAAAAGALLLDDLLGLGSPFGTWWRGEPTPFFLLGALLAQPLLSVLRFCAYLELRTAREGLDAWFSIYSAAAEERR